MIKSTEICIDGSLSFELQNGDLLKIDIDYERSGKGVGIEKAGNFVAELINNNVKLIEEFEHDKEKR